jgi:anti-sigma B factor antagonist
VNLSVTAEVVDGVCVVRVTGDVDFATAGRLRDALLTSAAGGRPVVVDLSGVAFLDAAGLSALVAGRRAAAGRLTVVGATGIARRILDLTGLLNP